MLILLLPSLIVSQVALESINSLWRYEAHKHAIDPTAMVPKHELQRTAESQIMKGQNLP